MAIETAPFFVKSHKIFESKEILGYLVQRLTCAVGGSNDQLFNLDYRGMLIPPKGFYEEFYSGLKEKNPEAFKRVIDSYSSKNRGRIDLSLISGEDIFYRLDTISGPTRYEDNIRLASIGIETIRGKFGPYQMPDTICHVARDQKEAQDNLFVLKKFGLI